MGEYKSFEIADDEVFLGFKGYLATLGITALCVIKWKPPAL